MATWGPLIALFPLWLLATFAPGFIFVRKLRWSPVERLCAAAGFSLFLIYLGAFAIYILKLGPWAYWLMTAACLIAAIAYAPDWKRLLRLYSIRHALKFFATLLFFDTLCQCLCRHYSGGLWSGDWYIHFQKTAIFLHGGPANDFELRNRVLERPGMMTLIGTYFLGLTGLRFDAFQLTYAWLNILSVLPCCLIARLFAPRATRNLWTVAAMLICLPMLWVNATYTWTKLLAAFYVLNAIWFYLRSLRTGDQGRMVAAFAFFAMGVLTHLVAIPYAVFAFGHYLLMVWRTRQRRARELTTVTFCGSAILLTWYGWVLARYGLQILLASNNTIQLHGAQTFPQVCMKIARNFVWTIFPHPFLWSSGVYEQANRLGFVRDYLFLLYQSNLFLVTGSATGIAAAVIAYRLLRLKGHRGPLVYTCMALGAIAVVVLAYLPSPSFILFDLLPKWGMMAVAVAAGGWIGGTIGMLLSGNTQPASKEVWFWRGLVLFLPIAGAIAIDVPCEYGYAHIFFHPWAMMGVTLVAVNISRWRWPVRLLVAFGMLVDFALGVWLQFYLQAWSFHIRPDGTIDANGLHMQVGLNWFDKIRMGFVFMGDRLAPISGLMTILLAIAGISAVIIVVCSSEKRIMRGKLRDLQLQGHANTMLGPKL